MYKTKYIKYKTKYLKNKNHNQLNYLYNKIGGKSDIVDIPNDSMTKEQYFEIIRYGYWPSIIHDFMRAIKPLEKDLINLKNKKGVDKLYVICPGDSPYKIIKYFEELSICNFCKFVNFPFSRPHSLFKYIKKEEGDYKGRIVIPLPKTKDYDPEQTYEYLKKYLPDDYSNLIFMDSIDMGMTILIILDALTKKNESNINSSYYEINKKIVEQMYNIILNRKKSDDITFKLESNEYIINLYKYKGFLHLEDYLFNSEREFSRCVQSFPKHDEKYLKKKFDSESCKYFIKIMVLTKLHWDWYEEFCKFSREDGSMYTQEELDKINIENLFKKYTNIDPNKLSWNWKM